MISRFSPLCWALPATPTFNVKDAQAKQVLSEAGALQRIIYSKTGVEYAEYLRTRELPGIGITADLIEEYLNALGQLDVRGFRQFFPVRSNGDPFEIVKYASLTRILSVFYPTIDRIKPYGVTVFVLPYLVHYLRSTPSKIVSFIFFSTCHFVFTSHPSRFPQGLF